MGVSMKFPVFLLWLLVPTFLSAQVTPSIRGGGTLRVADVSYRFEPSELASARPKTGQPDAFRMKGRLVPLGPGRPFGLELILLKDGRLYELKIQRKEPGGYPETWAATQKTRVKIQKLDDRPGGRIEVSLEGPLTGIMGRKPTDGLCIGTFWAGFPDESDEDGP